MSAADAETLLKKIRKLDGNRTCPNCGTPAPTGLGFGNICVKFKIFVCDMCKTSHQAISHRCKSVSMSTWTMEEVRALTGEEGGGNDAARHVWLASAPVYGARYPGGSRPKQGDRIDIFKQFVVDCYEKGMFKATTPYVMSSNAAAPAAARSVPSSVSAAPAPVAPAPAPQVDLFDTSFSSAPAPPAHLKINVQQPAWPHNDPFGAPFAAPQSAQAASSNSFASFDAFAAPPAASNSAPQTDMFSGVQVHYSPAAATTSSTPIARTASNSSGDFFGSSPTAFQAPAPVIPAPSHDPFGTDLLTPMSATASASPMGGSPMALGGSGGMSPRPMMMGTAPAPMVIPQQQQQARSGMAISSLMGPGGVSAPMGMRSPVAGGFNGGAMPMAQQKDSFDFVRDTMGAGRGSPMAGNPSAAGPGMAYGGAAISAMGSGPAIGGMQPRGPAGMGMGMGGMGMGGMPMGANGGGSVMNSGRNMMMMSAMPSPQQMQMQAQQNNNQFQRSGFGFM